MSYPPVVADFKAQFVRGFVYGEMKSQVMDSDISQALTVTAVCFSRDPWISDAEASTAFLYATAHFLALNIQDAGGLTDLPISQGVLNRGSSAITAKTVGSVSVTYGLPESITQSPTLSPFLKTGYGILYLQMLTPRLVGNIFVAPGPLYNWASRGK